MANVIIYLSSPLNHVRIFTATYPTSSYVICDYLSGDFTGNVIKITTISIKGPSESQTVDEAANENANGILFKNLQ